MTFAMQIAFETNNPAVQKEVLTEEFRDKMIEAFHGAFREIDSELVGLRVKEMPANGEITYWCEAHNRRATSIDEWGQPCCDPKLPGIMIPCKVVIKL